MKKSPSIYLKSVTCLFTVSQKRYRNTTVVIRIGIDNEYPNEFDHDMRVGVYDGTYANMFYIVDVHNYKKYPPCYPIVDIVDKARVTGKVPMSFKMTLNPRERYGYCETSQDGGFLSAGVFGEQVDMTKGQLLVQRHGAGEEYFTGIEHYRNTKMKY